MLTIFTNPRTFSGLFNIIQRNAIQSWLKLRPQCEIILLGEDGGAAEIAAEFKVKIIPDIERNEFGTPLMNSVFDLAEKIARYPLMAYLSSDIILLQDFIEAVKKIKKPRFLMVGQRIDLDIKEEIDFTDPGWKEKLRKLAAREGKLHGQGGSDYFVFPRGLWQDIPPFAIGRTVHDNWLLYKARVLGVPLIDATQVITALHQNHSHSHHPQGERGVRKGKEAQENLKLAGGSSHVLTLRDADWILTREGPKKAKINLSYIRRYFEFTLPAFYPRWQMPGRILALFLSPKRGLKGVFKKIKQ